jgi:hypothetical protein
VLSNSAGCRRWARAFTRRRPIRGCGCRSWIWTGDPPARPKHARTHARTRVTERVRERSRAHTRASSILSITGIEPFRTFPASHFTCTDSRTVGVRLRRLVAIPVELGLHPASLRPPATFSCAVVGFALPSCSNWGRMCGCVAAVVWWGPAGCRLKISARFRPRPARSPDCAHAGPCCRDRFRYALSSCVALMNSWCRPTCRQTDR